jgi:hypothetical protein
MGGMDWRVSGDHPCLDAPCARTGIALSSSHQPRYDNSYYFVSKFMPDHVA